MERRKFMQQSLLAGASLAASPTLMASCSQNTAEAGKTFTMDFAFHDNMFKNHGGNDFIDQIKWAHDQGFRSIEDNGMMARPVEMQEKIGNTLAKLGMRMGVFVITTDNWHWKTTLTTGKEEWVSKMEKDCRTAVEVAKRCNAKWVTVVPGNYERSLPIETQTANVVSALRKAADILEPAGLIMVLEPLSDNEDLFLRLSGQTFNICKAVNSPSCKILYDIYHMQRNEGNLMANIDKYWEEISYIQIGDNPGRKEPGTGEINYTNVFKHIYNKGYRGVMGMEHGNAMPGKEGEIALIKAYREVDVKAGA
ncbi:hydroxypyruvate isomerase family protein [Pseudobacter ginsenosidimutans]|uniref:Hydroxypyruvate isomerase n=1 Tax=Pseudobacter ginsenosidimutans TaxID=661488 RepID=A0A4V2F0T2_9BACT|nr:TIM barrel protein [Pseudobacter ginsenosidimutans]QEC41951.1 TIM barrel protein [Pseudobacter ginsenosidimutans]RZS71221.1 hydroxypyruvate isomerase [Pseudobacter ginsenosidimutans]